jgi:hypothetical protein
LSTDKNSCWLIDSTSNWIILKYDTALNQQILDATTNSFNDLKLTFTDTLGKFKIDFFFNNAFTSSATRIYTWYKIEK